MENGTLRLTATPLTFLSMQDRPLNYKTSETISKVSKWVQGCFDTSSGD